MKISESFLGQTLLNQTKPHGQSNFEQLINTPTKQNTGDAFYWQHLDQLQQSALRFDTRNLKSPKPIQNQSVDDETPIHQNTAQTVLQCVQQREEADSFRGNSIPQNTQLPLLQINKHMPLQSPHNGLPDYIKPVLKPIDKCFTHSISNTPSLLKGLPDSKKHHLFIQDNQAELSLNTEDLTPIEEKELIQLIQNHLKQAGLSLRHLIINGVKQ